MSKKRREELPEGGELCVDPDSEKLTGGATVPPNKGIQKQTMDIIAV